MHTLLSVHNRVNDLNSRSLTCINFINPTALSLLFAFVYSYLHMFPRHSFAFWIHWTLLAHCAFIEPFWPAVHSLNPVVRASHRCCSQIFSSTHAQCVRQSETGFWEIWPMRELQKLLQCCRELGEGLQKQKPVFFWRVQFHISPSLKFDSEGWWGSWVGCEQLIHDGNQLFNPTWNSIWNASQMAVGVLLMPTPRPYKNPFRGLFKPIFSHNLDWGIKITMENFWELCF